MYECFSKSNEVSELDYEIGIFSRELSELFLKISSFLTSLSSNID